MEAHPRRECPGAPHGDESGGRGSGLGRIAGVELDLRSGCRGATDQTGQNFRFALRSS